MVKYTINIIQLGYSTSDLTIGYDVRRVYISGSVISSFVDENK